MWVRDYSKLLEMAPFDRSHTSSYWPSTVAMALSYIISEISEILVGNRDFSYLSCIRRRR